ncbi:MAG: hypothetical protein RLY71_712 [Pseudomonadota bacterium]|jgi:Tfp pilus assembly protein PilV
MRFANTRSMPHRHTPPAWPLGAVTRPSRCGSALVEVLVALLVLSVGLGALVQAQTWLWLATDQARQLSEATRIAQDDLEQQRASAWADLAAQPDTALTGPDRNTVYRLQRQVSLLPDQDVKAVRVLVRWSDRQGEAQQFALDSLLARLDPTLAGALLTAPQRLTSPPATGRHPLIPRNARDLGDGRSAYKPVAGRTLTWVFDNHSGLVTARCDSAAALGNAQLDASSLGSCRALAGMSISGQVRFATDSASPGAAQAENPTSAALDLDMTLGLTSSGHPNPGWECTDDAPASPGASTLVHYMCVVAFDAAVREPRWSGRLDIVPVGWTLAASGVASRRVCRYSSDTNHNGRIDNVEHPAVYVDVTGPLGEQNFLIIPADAGCPRDATPQLGSLVSPNLVDDSTVAHQP